MPGDLYEGFQDDMPGDLYEGFQDDMPGDLRQRQNRRQDGRR